MPARRDDWITEVKTNPEKYCWKNQGYLEPSTQMIMREFECSAGSANKLGAIIQKTLAERRRNQSVSEKPVS